MTTATHRPADVALLVGAARAEAGRLERAARRAAVEVEAERQDGREVRASAVRIVKVLAEAARLEQLAADLDEGRLAVAGLTDRAAGATVHALIRDAAPTVDEQPVDEQPVDEPAPTAAAAPAAVLGADDEDEPTDDELADAMAALEAAR